MKTYTEKELLLAIDYACLMQKAECYQVVGNILISDSENFSQMTEDTLNYLANPKVISGQIKIEDVEEYFEPEYEWEIVQKPMSYEVPNYNIGFDPSYENGSPLAGKIYITKKK